MNYSVIQGGVSSELRMALNDSVVQRLLLDIAIKPRTKEYINSALQKTNVSIEQLLSHMLIRCQEDINIINFLLFTKDDMYRMHEITESHAQILAHALLKRRSEIETILKSYKQSSGVDPRATLYIILGCFSLDWDGLKITADRGYRGNKSLFSRIFQRPIIYAWEPVKLSRKGLYKGSHNSTYGIATLTSFGDHEIQPREFLPDILWNQDYYPDSLKWMIEAVIKASSEKVVGKQIGLMMLALREGNKSLAELARAADIGQEKASELVYLLIELGYIAQEDNYYSTRIPVLSQIDVYVVTQIRRIGREELKNYFDLKYETLCKELSQLTPFSNGVKQSDFFYNIWHDIFGATNRILVEAGLFADPYSKFYGAKGIIPVVFNSSLYDEP